MVRIRLTAGFMEDNGMLKVVLAGIGGISGAHIPAWEKMEGVFLAAICDVRPEMLQKYPDKRGYTDVDEMLAAEKPDILDICLPTDLHVSCALKAMKAGIHVVCEKPVSLHEGDVRLLYETAKENGVCFMVAQVLRFWPEYLLVRKMQKTQRYGKPLSAFMRRVGEVPRASCGNWMLDEARSGMVPFDLHIHDLDFLVYTFGEPESFSADRSKRPEQDVLNVVYRYKDFYAETEAAWYACPYPFTAEFRFQFEHAVIAGEKGKCMLYTDDGRVTDLASSDGEFALVKGDPYAAELTYFCECVKKGRFPEIVDPEELCAVIRILQSI